MRVYVTHSSEIVLRIPQIINISLIFDSGATHIYGLTGLIYGLVPKIAHKGPSVQ